MIQTRKEGIKVTKICMMPSPVMKIFPTFQDMLKVTVIMMKTAMGWNACWESSGSTLVMKMGGRRQHRQEVKEFAVAEQFSFVFDSMNKLKLTSGFIQGTKKSLPASRPAPGPRPRPGHGGPAQRDGVVSERSS